MSEAEQKQNLLPALQDYNWESAFSCASGSAQGGCDWAKTPDPAPGSATRVDPFNREDVVDIEGISEGENDERDWLVCGRLRDGRFFFLAAGCDYTGWDCRSNGRAYVATTWTELRLVITNEEWTRLTHAGDACVEIQKAMNKVMPCMVLDPVGTHGCSLGKGHEGEHRHFQLAHGWPNDGRLEPHLSGAGRADNALDAEGTAAVLAAMARPPDAPEALRELMRDSKHRPNEARTDAQDMQLWNDPAKACGAVSPDDKQACTLPPHHVGVHVAIDPVFGNPLAAWGTPCTDKPSPKHDATDLQAVSDLRKSWKNQGYLDATEVDSDLADMRAWLRSETVEACVDEVLSMRWPPDVLDDDRARLNSGFVTAAQAIYKRFGKDPVINQPVETHRSETVEPGHGYTCSTAHGEGHAEGWKEAFARCIEDVEACRKEYAFLEAHPDEEKTCRRIMHRLKSIHDREATTT